MRSKWQLVRDLFERALEEQPADLDAWLAERTDDSEVRAEVRTLLDQLTAAGEFLTAPVQDRFPSLLDDGNAPAQSEDDLYQPGDVIGHYTIVRELGHGGMGWVYLATDSNLKQRKVALKALAPRFTGVPAHNQRLRREAETAGGLSHWGICTVYELYEHEGHLFIASEYVEGHTLRDEIDGGRRPQAAEILQTSRNIAEALAFAHERGVVHRDLKPENVMRTSDGRIKILDFGLARVDRSASDPNAIQVTESGAVVGTVGYLAPERLNGRPGDARADVFALGVMLYEWTSGVHPFPGSSYGDVVMGILQSNPTPIDDLCPALPPSICAVIEQCLRKQPAQRFASAAEVLATLSIEPRLTAPTPNPRIAAVVRWWRAHQATVIGLYFLACAFAWLVKEELGSAALALAVFGIISAAATVGGVVRGHLLFVGRRIPRAMMPAELLRTGPITLGVDVVIAMALCVDAALLLVGDSGRHVAAALIAGFGIGVLVARLRLEPSTTRDAFPT